MKSDKEKAFAYYKIHQLSQDHLTILIPIGMGIYCSFFLIDVLYQGFSEMAIRWGIYRLSVFLIAMYLRHELIKKQRSYKTINWIAVCLVSMACTAINLMIYESGGIDSEYLQGVLLAATGGIFMLLLSPFYTAVTLIIGFLPTVLIIIGTAPPGDYHIALIKASFPLGMGLAIFGGSIRANNEVKRFVAYQIKSRISDVLKKAFPVQLRLAVESGNKEVLRPKIIDNALVGFVDIASSTAIGNQIACTDDWIIKDRFTSNAIDKAEEYGFTILNYLGDGVVFIKTGLDGTYTMTDLVRFFDSLKKDYQMSIEPFNTQFLDCGIKTGLACGICYGSLMSGIIGNSKQAFFTVNGPEVNLASRLCSLADLNGLAFSSDLWEILNAGDIGIHPSKITSEPVKGFSEKIDVFHLTDEKEENNYLPNAV